MRRHLILLVVLLALGIGGYLFVQGEFFGDPSPATSNGDGGTRPGNTPPGRPTNGKQDGIGRQRLQPGEHGTPDVVRYRVVDATTREGIPGASILRLKGGSRVAKTDAQGYAPVADYGLTQLVFAADGYLLNHYALGEDETESVYKRYLRLGHVEVRLEADFYTLSRPFRFLAPDGSPAKRVSFRVACRDEPKPGGRSIPTERTGSTGHVEPEIRRAWLKHHGLSLAGLGLAASRTHFGADSELFEFKSGAETTVQFVATGRYRITAWSPGGDFVEQEFEVTLQEQRALTVRLNAGLYLQGQLLSAGDDKPVYRATVLVKEGEEVVHMGTTDERGRFKIGPWNERRVHLEITHNWHLPKTVGPLVASRQDVIVRLVPRPVQQLRGVVRQRPSRAPIPGAAVVVWVEGIEEVTARTDKQGRFTVRSPIKEPQILIRAKGYLEYREIVNADAGSLTYDLVPATPEARVRAGLTALLTGTVTGRDGKPVAGQPVHILPEKEPGLAGLSGRRILEGGAPPLSRTVITDARGRFALEWGHAGGARLVAVRGIVDDDQGRFVNVVLGRRRENIQLTLPR